MKRLSSIPALAAGALVFSSITAIGQSPALAQSQQVKLQEVCHEDTCVTVETTSEASTQASQPTVQPAVDSARTAYPEAYPEADHPYPVLPVEPIADRPVPDEDRFFCGTDEYGVPTTLVANASESLPLIRWESHYFSGSGYDPQTRCEQVTDRFNRFYEEGLLNYITTGIVNRQPVVCVSGYIGGPCTDVLFTLKPWEDATQTIQQLFDVRAGAAGPLSESGDRVYIDFGQHLGDLSRN
jgi:hypothetical protein